MSILLPKPNTQIDFANALIEMRSLYLQEALTDTIAEIKIQELDAELHSYCDSLSLQKLASYGMRGELLFATPIVLTKNPRLLGYYRLLLGYSQKSFYTAGTGVGIYKSMEEKGSLSSKQKESLPNLCSALNDNAKYMLNHLSPSMLNHTFFEQLTLLTLGPQLRGGANVQRGSSAMVQLFDLLFSIVKPSIVEYKSNYIKLDNNSHRTVFIQFAADPDIVIREELAPDTFKNLIAIEVKGGQDYSNIHNRVGEAEKSHQKARKAGYVECWTIVNVDRINIEMAQRESPSTNRFFRLSDLLDNDSTEYRVFSLQIRAITGI